MQRHRKLGVALSALGLLALGACASPRATGQGDLTVLRDHGVAVFASQADAEGADAGWTKAIGDRALARLASVGAKTGTAKPAYLVQVGVATAPPTVGVSSAAGALDASAWRSQPPVQRPWTRRGPVRTVTLAVVDATTGKTIAWSSIRARKGEPAALADRLMDALAPAKS